MGRFLYAQILPRWLRQRYIFNLTIHLSATRESRVLSCVLLCVLLFTWLTYKVKWRLHTKLRQGMNFVEVPNVTLCINFIMHTPNCHNGNIDSFHCIFCNESPRGRFRRVTLLLWWIFLHCCWQWKHRTLF